MRLLNQATVMATDAAALTATPFQHILTALSAQSGSNGIGTPTKRHPAVEPMRFFYAYRKLKTTLCRFSYCYGVAVLGKRKLGRPLFGSSNPIQSATQRLEPMGSGYILKTKDTAMNTSTDEIRLQNPQTQPINPLAKAIFELESIETLSLQSNKPNLSNPALTLSTIFAHSQRGLNALHDLKNLLGIVPPAEKQGGAL